MNAKQIMEMGALADAIYTEHGKDMQQALFGTVARHNPPDPPADNSGKKKLKQNLMMGLAGAMVVLLGSKVYKG